MPWQAVRWHIISRKLIFDSALHYKILIPANKSSPGFIEIQFAILPH